MSKVISKSVGKRIRKLREMYCMNGVEFGALLGISQQHQSRCENGESNIHAETLYYLSHIFDLDLDYFFNDVFIEKKDNQYKKY